jgi:hypothetical protein
MVQISQDLKATFDNIMRPHALDIGDKANTAGIVFVRRVVETLSVVTVHQPVSLQ